MILKHGAAIMSYNDRDIRKDGAFVGTSLARKTYNTAPEITVTGIAGKNGKIIPELQKVGVEYHDNDYSVYWSKKPRIIYKNPKQHPANIANRKRLRKLAASIEAEKEAKIKDLVFDHDVQLVEEEYSKKLEGLPVAAEKKMSIRTRSKIRNKVVTWYRTKLWDKKGREDKVHFSLVTLTFTENCSSKGISQSKCNEILNHFLTRMRKVYGLFSYVWVAEVQDGKRNSYAHSTGNLHYHIIIDKWFNVQVLNRLWLKVLAGYGFSVVNEEGKWRQPLDLKYVKSAKHVSHYLTKYVTKNKTAIKTALWNCSRSISRLGVGIYKVIDFDELDSIAPNWRDNILFISAGLYVIPYKFTPLLHYHFISLYQFNLEQLKNKNHGETKNQKKEKEHVKCPCKSCAAHAQN